MNLADHSQEEYQKILYRLQKNIFDDRGARSLQNVRAHCDWIQQTFASAAGKPLDILDLGCGIGLYSITLAEKGHRVVGVDISPYVVADAKRSMSKSLKCTFLVENILNFKAENKFDLVIFTYSIFNLLNKKEVAQLLTNIFCLLREGGHFYFEPLNFMAKDTELESGIHLTHQCAADLLYPNSKTIIADHEWLPDEKTMKSCRYYILDDKTVKKTTSKIYFYEKEGYQLCLTQAGFGQVQFITSPPGTTDNDYLPYISICSNRG